MVSATLPLLSQHEHGATSQRPVPIGVCESRLAEAAAAIQAWRKAPSNLEAWDTFATSLSMAGEALGSLTRVANARSLQASLRQLIQATSESGAHERLAALDTRTVEVGRGWGGMVAFSLVRPAWCWAGAVDPSKLPDWVVEIWMRWWFATPPSAIVAGQAERFASHRERQLGELIRWLSHYRGAGWVQKAVEAYSGTRLSGLLEVSTSSLRGLAEAHSKLLPLLTRLTPGEHRPAVLPRDNRRLRVAFVAEAFEDPMFCAATLPLITNLDGDRFEVTVFVVRLCGTRWEEKTRAAALQFLSLPCDFAQQQKIVAQGMFDVVVFCGPIAADLGAVPLLASARLAPLQVVSSAHQAITSGMTTVDLFVTGGGDSVAASSPEFTERLAIMPGPARVFDPDTFFKDSPLEVTREAVGLPANALVFASASRWEHITPETRIAWARMLASVPESFLLLQQLGGGASDDLATLRLCAEMDSALQAFGVAENRVVILPARLDRPSDISAVLSLGDVFVDTLFSSDEIALLAALKAGVPAITMPGSTARSSRSAAVLKSLGLADLVATGLEEYQQIALRLAERREPREAVTERIKLALACVPWPFDTLAAGDAFGDVLERGFDELLAVGRARFAEDRTPLRVSDPTRDIDEHVRAGAAALADRDYFHAFSEARAALKAQPNSSRARALLGRALLALGQPVRAVDYLLPSVEQADADAGRWLSLAQALQQSGRGSECVQALQASLQLDPQQPGAWRMLIEIAEHVGLPDLADDALMALKQHCAGSSEIGPIESRLASKRSASTANDPFQALKGLTRST